MQKEDKCWPQWNPLEDLKKSLNIPFGVRQEIPGLLLGKVYVPLKLTTIWMKKVARSSYQ